MTLHASFDRETAKTPIPVRTQDDLDAVIERVRSESAGWPCPPILMIYNAENPWKHPIVSAGFREDEGIGFVQENGHRLRATRGNGTGEVVYDYQANEAIVPADQEVPFAVVRAVLGVIVANGGQAPDDCPDLHDVPVERPDQPRS
ncbi:Imm1 family immunity protein [Actinosynnema sp. NPDC000082]|uniref:Imm1 family immunity protein n=1 Tax=Actinosynnema sp. NPDC000082 TaxID=3363910 RepID=UPI0036C985CF